MIYKHKLYRTLDHWESIRTFYNRKVKGWTDFQKIKNKENITLDDIVLCYNNIKTSEYDFFKFQLIDNNFSINGGVYSLRPPPDLNKRVYILSTVHSSCIFLDTTCMPSNELTADFAFTVAAIDNFRFFRYYLRESGIFKVLMAHLSTINLVNKEFKYIEESSTMCDSCLQSTINLINANIHEVEDIYNYCVSYLSKCKCTFKEIVIYLNSTFNQFKTIIHKELESTGLVLSQINDYTKICSSKYSISNNLAFIVYETKTSNERITILYKNSENGILVYRNQKIYCPYNHYNVLTKRDSRCKTKVTFKDPIKLIKVIYGNDKTIDSNEDNSLFSDDVIYINGSRVNHEKDFKDIYCTSNIKKLNIDISKIGEINVRRSI